MIPLITLCLTVPLEFGLQPLPEDSLYRDEGFTKYVEVIAQNGKPIPIIAQKGVRDIAVARYLAMTNPPLQTPWRIITRCL